MRSNKRFTNTTFTKRVDHEAGRHHTKRAGKEPAMCASCGSVYSKRRWTAAGPGTTTTEATHSRPARVTTCPACIQIHGGNPSGYVFIEGGFAAAHREEIEQLLRNEAARAAEDNPLARIMLWTENGDRKLTLSTTTEHLAQRLGHALEKAYDGTVDYDFSHENKLARVTWHRQ
ncbi:MAG: BCAM0308 family protein [Acidobacteriota bacterium]